VLILADDMGHGHVGHLNPKSKIATPHIDALAKQGISFTDAHSGSAVCSPTRYGLLTGRYAWRTRLVRGVLQPYDPPLIEADRLTLPGLLKQHGYHTACIGKWHLGWDWPQAAPQATPDFTKPIANGPITRGFDFYFGTHVPNHPPYCFIENDRTVGQPTAEKTERDLDGRPGPMLPGWKFDAILPSLAERATAYIAERAKPDEPFFLYLPLTTPHEPIAPSAAFRGKSGLNPLADLVMETDAVVGQVLAAIDQHRLAEKTLVIFTADNGSSLYTGGNELIQRGHPVSAGWRGAKSSIYEGGHRVPFVARWPGVIPAGKSSSETICLTDILATTAAVVGHDLPRDAGEDSYNILPVLKAEPTTAPIREATVHQSAQGLLAIRQDKWKLVSVPTSELPAPLAGKAKAKSIEPRVPELYDLAADPAETTNLHTQQVEVAHRLHLLLEKYRQTGRSRP
jgi:arylsulfatase A-like enzyme